MSHTLQKVARHFHTVQFPSLPPHPFPEEIGWARVQTIITSKQGSYRRWERGEGVRGSESHLSQIYAAEKLLTLAQLN